MSKQSSFVQKIGDRLVILSIDAAFGVALNLDNLGQKKIQEPLRRERRSTTPVPWSPVFQRLGSQQGQEGQGQCHPGDAASADWRRCA